jgi:hypothetical protein
VSKLAAYFAVYSKTEISIDTSFRALFGDVTPEGHAPVNVDGTFYNVAAAVQPDPSQQLTVAVFGQQPDRVNDARTVPLVSNQIIDKNGNPVPTAPPSSLICEARVVPASPPPVNLRRLRRRATRFNGSGACTPAFASPAWRHRPNPSQSP